MKYKFIVVGAGLAGLTMAERIASQLNEKVLIVEKRNHIGGNVYDEYNEDDILIQKYGPHIFHTSNKSVFSYLSRFTQWNLYQHKVLTFVDGNFIPMPITLETINNLYNLNLSPEEMKQFIDARKIKIDKVTSSEDVALSTVGQEIYEKFFKNYTKKQWGAEPKELDTGVISRIPLRFSRDTRYFTDTYQVMPKYGYTKMCNHMIENYNIKVLLNTDYKEIINDIKYEYLIYTGPIDYFFDYQFGKLKYRSLKFEMQTFSKASYQNAAVVNYPNDYDFTRITEFKKLTGQENTKTTIMKEYPCFGDEPFYPYPTVDCLQGYEQYRKMETNKKEIFVGRLAEYKYYNMDRVIERAFQLLKDNFNI